MISLQERYMFLKINIVFLFLQHTLLVVSHDAGFLDSVCTDIIHLDDAKLNTYRYFFVENILIALSFLNERLFLVQSSL